MTFEFGTTHHYSTSLEENSEAYAVLEWIKKY